MSSGGESGAGPPQPLTIACPSPPRKWARLGGNFYSVSGKPAEHSSLAVDSRGRVFVGFEASNAQLAIRRFAGTRWRFDAQEFTTHDVGWVELALDGREELHVAHTIKGRAYVAKVREGRIYLYSDVAVSEAHAAYLSLAFDSKQTPFLAYRDERVQGRATVKKWVPSAGRWLPVGPSSFTAGGSAYHSLAMDAANVPYLAFQDRKADPAKGPATVMKFVGDAWEAVGAAGFTGGAAAYTSLALSSAGVPHVAYADGGKGGRPSMMRFDGSKWVLVGPRGFAAGPAAYVTLKLGAGDTPYVAFQEAGRYVSVMSYDGATNKWATVGGGAHIWDTGTVGNKAQWVSMAVQRNGTVSVAFAESAPKFASVVMQYS